MIAEVPRPTFAGTSDAPSKRDTDEGGGDNSASGRASACPLIFIHIPKAAGTTFQHLVEDRFARKFRFSGDTEEWNAFKRLSAEERDSFDLLYGHVHFGVHEHLARPAMYVTMLRDPVDRIVSHYYFVRQHPDHYLHSIAAECTLEQYATRRTSHELDNDQVRWLTTPHHFDVPVGKVSRTLVEEAKWNLANAFPAFGITSQFERSVRWVSRALCWQGVEIPPRQNATRDRPALEEVSPATIAAIREINRYDAELFEFASALFEERAPAGCEAASLSVSDDGEASVGGAAE
ncbi:MAG: sulfotransferase family 2 domain-containing protein [Phycisphaerales bacterium]